MCLVQAYSSLCSLSLSSCEKALHLMRLLQQLSKQASAAAAAENSDTPMLLRQSQRNCHHGTHPNNCLHSTSRSSDRDRAPPAPSQASQQPATTTATTNVNGDDVGMTPGQVTTPPPVENGDPSLSASANTEPVVNAGEDANPACPPTAAATTATTAPRADATAADNSEAAPAPVITPDEGVDLPGYLVTEANRSLMEVALGDHVHDNDGTRLQGGFANDTVWQHCWRRMAQIATRRCQVPADRVGRRFFAILATEFRSVRNHLWNSERPLVLSQLCCRRHQGCVGPRTFVCA